MEKRELTQEEIKMVFGGSRDGYRTHCPHVWRATDSYREDPFLIFWSRRQRLYICGWCGQTDWRNV